MGFEYLTAEQMEAALKTSEEPAMIDGDALLEWCRERIELIRREVSMVKQLNKYDLICEYHKVTGEILRMIGGGR